MSSERTTRSPLNVGPNTGVLRGSPNFSNASRGAPESVIEQEGLALLVDHVVEERAELRARELRGRVGDCLHERCRSSCAAMAVPVLFSSSSMRVSSRSACSARLRSVMSSMMPMNCAGSPVASAQRVTVVRLQTICPSLRT